MGILVSFGCLKLACWGICSTIELYFDVGEGVIFRIMLLTY
jgi:hypothetical protein